MPIVPNLVEGEDGEFYFRERTPEEMPDPIEPMPSRVFGVFDLHCDPPMAPGEALHFEFRVEVYSRMYSFLERNHSRLEIDRFIRAYIRDEAVAERGRLLLGRKFSTVPAEFLDLIELANSHALNFATKGDIDEYWLRQYGFCFLRLLATWDFKVLDSITAVLRKRQELQDQGICDAKGNSRVAGKGRDRIGEKELILKFVTEKIRDAQTLPMKVEVRDFLRAEGRSVGKNFYSERLFPLGLDGLPDLGTGG